MIAYSVLDLSPIAMGSNAAQSLRETLDLAQHAERWGYRRYWLAEHHNMPGIASAATSVVICHVASGTSALRVGAGGIMLPNHPPLVVAEQFGTLESLFPGRIDLGLGRGPGANEVTCMALRSNPASDAEQFSRDVSELIGYFAPPSAGQPVTAVPGGGLAVPIWILGSSLSGAQLAAVRGLPFAFASHFAPATMMQAIDLYRAQFQPSEQLDRPHLMLAFNVFAAESDARAQFLATSMKQAFMNMRNGRPTQLPPPIEGYDDQLPPTEQQVLAGVLACSAIGSPETVRRALIGFIERTLPDELMITSQIFDHRARLRSYEIAAEELQQIS